MKDIVARLRSLLTAAIFPERREIIEEAAAEIERLRTANEYAFGGPSGIGELAKLREEVSRLEAALDEQGAQ